MRWRDRKEPKQLITFGSRYPFFGNFAHFLLKRRCTSQRIFRWNYLNNRWAFWYELMLILRSKKKSWSVRRKNWRAIWPKNFFLTFHIEKSWEFSNSFYFFLQQTSQRCPQLWSLYTRKFRVKYLMLIIMLKNLSCYVS